MPYCASRRGPRQALAGHPVFACELRLAASVSRHPQRVNERSASTRVATAANYPGRMGTIARSGLSSEPRSLPQRRRLGAGGPPTTRTVGAHRGTCSQPPPRTYRRRTRSSSRAAGGAGRGPTILATPSRALHPKRLAATLSAVCGAECPTEGGGHGISVCCSTARQTRLDMEDGDGREHTRRRYWPRGRVAARPGRPPASAGAAGACRQDG